MKEASEVDLLTENQIFKMEKQVEIVVLYIMVEMMRTEETVSAVVEDEEEVVLISTAMEGEGKEVVTLDIMDKEVEEAVEVTLLEAIEVEEASKTKEMTILMDVIEETQILVHLTKVEALSKEML
jgi:hypothetical protein